MLAIESRSGPGRHIRPCGVWLGMLLLAAWLVAITPRASGHTQLLATDPAEGALLPSAPSRVTFTFNETVDPVAETFQLVDSSGTVVPLTVSSSAEIITAELPSDLTDGSYVVGWRVISADGHPVAGGLTFSLGAATNVPDKAITTSQDRWVPRLLTVAQGLTYTGLLLSMGLLFFARFIGTITLESTLRSVMRIGSIAAAVAIAGGALTLPLTVARQRDLPLSELAAPAAWLGAIEGDQIRAFVALAVGLLGALLLFGRSRGVHGAVIFSAALLLALISPTLTGHTNSFSPVWILRAANLVHTIAAAIWLGGLAGLLLLYRHARTDSPSDNGESPARLLGNAIARFSDAAAWVVAGLTLSGVSSAWIILSDWRDLYELRYGQVLLAKIGAMIVLLLIAAWNHFSLVPRIARETSEGRAWHRLRQTVRTETVIVALVALATGFLVNLSPVSDAAETSTVVTAASIAFEAKLGQGTLSGTISPGRTGVTTVTITLSDAAGSPVSPDEAPSIEVSLPAINLGPIVNETSAGGEPGVYVATVTFPAAGQWQIAVPVRISRFEEPIASASVTIP